jgi:hypothetical protein
MEKNQLFCLKKRIFYNFISVAHVKKRSRKKYILKTHFFDYQQHDDPFFRAKKLAYDKSHFSRFLNYFTFIVKKYNKNIIKINYFYYEPFFSVFFAFFLW